MSELRILVIGKTGNGKSSVGNTLLGRPDAFESRTCMFSVTSKCKWELGNFEGKTIEVTDTPGLCDTDRKEEDVYIEVAKSVALSEPGPHVIMLVQNASRRFTKEECAAFSALKVLFSPELTQYLIVVFTEIDAYAKDNGPKTLGEQRRYLKEQVEDTRAVPSKLSDIIREASNRYIGINNLSPDTERLEQRRELIAMADKLKSINKNKCYSCDLLKDVKKNLETLVTEIAAKEGREFPEASIEAKKRIQDEFPDPTFWESMKTTVGRYYKRKANSLCSIM